MTVNHTTTRRRKDLHESVFIVVLVVLFGVMVWFFNAHPGHGSGASAAAPPTTSAGATTVR